MPSSHLAPPLSNTGLFFLCSPQDPSILSVLPIQNGASEHQTAEQSTRTRLLRINIVSVSHDRQEQSTDLKIAVKMARRNQKLKVKSSENSNRQLKTTCLYLLTETGEKSITCDVTDTEGEVQKHCFLMTLKQPRCYSGQEECI